VRNLVVRIAIGIWAAREARQHRGIEQAIVAPICLLCAEDFETAAGHEIIALA
jgi:hypothetical protein